MHRLATAANSDGSGRLEDLLARERGTAGYAINLCTMGTNISPSNLTCISL